MIAIKVVIICGAGPEFREHNFFGRMFYILLFAALQRQKYYFAWKLGIYCNCITLFMAFHAWLLAR